MDAKPSNVIGRRVAAWLIDWILGFALAWVLGEHETGDGSFSLSLHGGPFLLFLAIAVAYYWVWQGLTGFIVARTNPRHQRIGDMVAGTLVVRQSSSS